MEDDRLRIVDTVEKLEKSGRNSAGKSDLLPLQYGTNANPFNSTMYTYQVRYLHDLMYHIFFLLLLFNALFTSTCM